MHTLLFNLILIPVLHSDESVPGTSVGSYSWEALKVILSLALVLSIFYLLVYVFKKYMGGSFKSHSSIRMLGGISLSNKEKIVIIEAGKVNLLLGVSGAGVTKLHQFSDDELSVQSNEPESIVPSFGQQIEKILGNKQ